MIQKIKDKWESTKMIFQSSKNGLTLEIFVYWFFGWTPFFLIYKLTGLAIYLHDWSAEMANKVETYLLELLEESNKKNGNNRKN